METTGSADADRGREALADELLAVGCQLGDRAAFDALIARWHEPLWKYARRVTGSDQAAADVVQESWLRVLNGITRLRDPARLRAWLFGIARRVVMDRLREQYAEPPRGGVDPEDLAGPEAAHDTAEAIALMQAELNALPVIEREVLTLFYLQELSLVELADVLAVPVGTVKSRLFRARRLLRDELIRKGLDR